MVSLSSRRTSRNSRRWPAPKLLTLPLHAIRCCVYSGKIQSSRQRWLDRIPSILFLRCRGQFLNFFVVVFIFLVIEELPAVLVNTFNDIEEYVCIMCSSLKNNIFRSNFWSEIGNY